MCIKHLATLGYPLYLETMFKAKLQQGCMSLGVTSEYSFWALSVGYAISAKCFEEKESNKLPYFGSFSSVYSRRAPVDLKIAQRQTLKKNRVLLRQKIAFLQYGLKDRQ